MFQVMEASNPWYMAVPSKVESAMKKLGELTGRCDGGKRTPFHGWKWLCRQYELFDYYGAEDADRVVVVMGSGGPVVEEAVDYLANKGEKVG